VRVSRVGSEVDAVVGPRYIPGPDQSLVIGKVGALADDHLLNEMGGFRFVG